VWHCYTDSVQGRGGGMRTNEVKKREEQTEMGVGKLRLKIMSAVALDFRALKRHTKKAGKPAPLWSF